MVVSSRGSFSFSVQTNSQYMLASSGSSRLVCRYCLRKYCTSKPRELSHVDVMLSQASLIGGCYANQTRLVWLHPSLAA